MRATWLPFLAVLTLIAVQPTSVAGNPAYSAADPTAPVVTRENLLASDRFWPYQLELTQPWKPKDRAKALPAGALAVLVRVDPPGVARMDFGRDGRFDVPVEKTDLVRRANRIRSGEDPKMAPNFVHSIGTRLVDAQDGPLSPFDISAVFEARGFLAVFADPAAKGFADLAAALAPLRGRYGVMTVLFPEGVHMDARTRERLLALEWPVPFVMDHYGEGYTQSLLAEGTALPTLMLQTRDGRVLFQSPWREGVVPELTLALDRAFGNGAATTAGVDRVSSP